MKIAKVKTEYCLSEAKSNKTIWAAVSGDGELITLKTHDNHDKFEFRNSKKEDVKAIIELFKEALKLE